MKGERGREETAEGGQKGKEIKRGKTIKGERN